MIFERARKSFGHALVTSVVALAAVAGVASATYSVAHRHSVTHNNEETGRIVGRAISVLAAETATAADGYPLPPAGGPAYGDGYAVPTGSAAPKQDAFGTALLYCPWDNGGTNSSTNRINGDSPGSDASRVLAVVSAGVNKSLQTSCANVKAGISVGDDIVRSMTVDELRSTGGMKYYLAPVECENAATPTTDLAGNPANCTASRSRLDLLSTSNLIGGELITVSKSGKVFQWVSSVSQWRATSGQGGGYTAPDDFSFTPVTGADTNALVVSNTVTLTNVSEAAPVSIDSVGQYQVNGGAWTNMLGSVRPGDTLAVRLTSSPNTLTTVSTTVNVAGRTKTFSVTTGSIVIEEVFSVDTYTGNNGTKSITNNVDLAGKGGLSWVRARSGSYALGNHYLFDTVRGNNKILQTDSTGAQFVYGTESVVPNATGQSITGQNINNGDTKYALFTFRKAAKFFDILQYSGDGSGIKQISHGLGTAPGMIVIRNITGGDWWVYHRATPNGIAAKYSRYRLNTTDGVQQDSSQGGMTTVVDWGPSMGEPTSSHFYVQGSNTNGAGATYIAYLWAHDTSAEGLVQAGSVTTDGSGNMPTQNLGWEPGWILWKKASASHPWWIIDSTRGFTVNDSANSEIIRAESSLAPSTGVTTIQPTATGFKHVNGILDANSTYIYVAIRRGPMKKPTLGTQVFAPVGYTGGNFASSDTITTGFPVDFLITQYRTPFGTANQNSNRLTDRLLGLAPFFNTQSSNAQDSASAFTSFDMTGMTFNNFYTVQIQGTNPQYIHWAFRRWPGVVDAIVYAGGGGNTVKKHNLGVDPELAIAKRTDAPSEWFVSSKYLNSTWQSYLKLNSTDAVNAGSYAIYSPNSVQVTASSLVDVSGGKYLAYLFASLPGVSKIGTYVGSASDVTVDAGFSGSPRLLLIKRTDAPGNWVTFDTVRGISNGGADPALRLNIANEETNGVNFVEPTGSGFIAKTGNADINVNGGTYLFVAIR